MRLCIQGFRDKNQKNREKKLYNLLISGLEGQWKKTAWELERNRCVREYTDEEIKARFKEFSKDDIAALMSLPCLFAYESGIKKGTKLGWLTKIKASASVVRLEYEFEDGLPSITAAKVAKLTSELDITDWELNRTHWAVKDVNLIQVLMTAGLLNESQIRGLGADSKMVRFGLSTPITELQIKPSVFRVPNGKVEADLISVMMPFDMPFNGVCAAIRKACDDCDLRCQRADDIWNEAEVIQDVFSLIYRSRVVICDFSKKNPNVFYEAGIAHTLGKIVIPIAQNADDVPFDIRHMRYIKYLDNSEGREKLRKDISQKLRTIIG
jgi:hypothetical protein